MGMESVFVGFRSVYYDYYGLVYVGLVYVGLVYYDYYWFPLVYYGLVFVGFRSVELSGAVLRR